MWYNLLTSVGGLFFVLFFWDEHQAFAIEGGIQRAKPEFLSGGADKNESQNYTRLLRMQAKKL